MKPGDYSSTARAATALAMRPAIGDDFHRALVREIAAAPHVRKAVTLWQRIVGGGVFVPVREITDLVAQYGSKVVELSIEQAGAELGTVNLTILQPHIDRLARDAQRRENSATRPARGCR